MLGDTGADRDAEDVCDCEGAVEADSEGEGEPLRDGRLEWLAVAEPQALREGAGERVDAKDAAGPPSRVTLALPLCEGERAGEGLLAGDGEAAPEREGDAVPEGDEEAARGEGVEEVDADRESREGDAADDREDCCEAEMLDVAEGEAEARAETEGEREPARGVAEPDGVRTRVALASPLAEAECVVDCEGAGERVAEAHSEGERVSRGEGEGKGEPLAEREPLLALGNAVRDSWKEL